MADETNDPMDYLQQLNKPTVIAIGIVSLLLILALFPSSSQTYTLNFEIIVENNTEDDLTYRIDIDDKRQDFGDEIGALGDRLDCDPGEWCSIAFEKDFTYEEGFRVEFKLNAFGNENDLPEGCMEILVDFYSLDIDCTWYSDPDDGLNYGFLLLIVYVNEQVIDSV